MVELALRGPHFLAGKALVFKKFDSILNSSSIEKCSTLNNQNVFTDILIFKLKENRRALPNFNSFSDVDGDWQFFPGDLDDFGEDLALGW